LAELEIVQPFHEIDLPEKVTPLIVPGVLHAQIAA
jgi:hypothetical protein